MPAPAGSEQTFINDLAKDTGLDPKVILAWVTVEGAYAAGGTGGYNFLNIHESTSRSGVPLAGTSPKGFAQFHSAGQAAQETAWWINNMTNYRGIKTSASLSPQSQLAAIAASPWDSSHYGGGKKLFAEYASIVTGTGGSIISDIAKGLTKATQVITGAGGNPVELGIGAANAGAGLAGDIPVVGPVLKASADTAQGVATLANDTGKVLGFIFNPEDWLRIGYILAGGILALGGLFVLARSVGAVQSAAALAFPEGTLITQAASKAGVAAAQPAARPEPRQRAPRTRTRTVYVMDEEAERRERVRRRSAAAQPSNDIPY